MRVTRVAKLERFVRERPCTGCGRTNRPRAATASSEVERLSAADATELAVLLAAAATPPCARCGYIELDIGRLTDDQKRRALALLRVLCDSPFTRDST